PLLFRASRPLAASASRSGKKGERGHAVTAVTVGLPTFPSGHAPTHAPSRSLPLRRRISCRGDPDYSSIQDWTTLADGVTTQAEKLPESSRLVRAHYGGTLRPPGAPPRRFGGAPPECGCFPRFASHRFAFGFPLGLRVGPKLRFRRSCGFRCADARHAYPY